jgi:hypothetical protein
MYVSFFVGLRSFPTKNETYINNTLDRHNPARRLLHALLYGAERARAETLVGEGVIGVEGARDGVRDVMVNVP